MPEFIVRFQQAGSGVQQVRLQAPERHALAALLGVSPQRILSVEELAAAPAPASSRAGKRFPLQLFSQELSVLLSAGVTLVEALETLSEKESQADIRAALAAVVAALSAGQPLSAALRAQPQAFDELICALVAANERSGQLAPALAQHARYLAWVQQLRDRLVAACVYPAVLLGVGSAVILFLLLYVLPRFAGILDGLGSDLPWGSLLLLRFGRLTGEHPALVAAGLGGVALAAVLALRSAAVRTALQSRLWTLPALGPRLRVLALARFYRSLSMLLGAGVPVLQALEIVQPLMARPWQGAVTRLAAAVGEGRRFSEALEAENLATPVARRMVRVGERSGELAAMLERAAAFHDDEAVRLSEFLSRAINPALMLIMGVLIGGIIVLMYLPIFQLVEQVQ